MTKRGNIHFNRTGISIYLMVFCLAIGANLLLADPGGRRSTKRDKRSEGVVDKVNKFGDKANKKLDEFKNRMGRQRERTGRGESDPRSPQTHENYSLPPANRDLRNPLHDSPSVDPRNQAFGANQFSDPFAMPAHSTSVDPRQQMQYQSNSQYAFGGQHGNGQYPGYEGQGLMDMNHNRSNNNDFFGGDPNYGGAGENQYALVPSRDQMESDNNEYAAVRPFEHENRGEKQEHLGEKEKVYDLIEFKPEEINDRDFSENNLDENMEIENVYDTVPDNGPDGVPREENIYVSIPKEKIGEKDAIIYSKLGVDGIGAIAGQERNINYETLPADKGTQYVDPANEATVSEI